VAQLVMTSLIDDRDGSVASQTVSFAVDGKSYEIDLNDRHADQLREALAPYVAAGRRTGGAPARARREAAVGARPDLGAARAWLSAHGYPVKDRGRIPDAWLADFEAKIPRRQQDVEPASASKQASVVVPIFRSAG
jgi:hypothetical protein